MSKVFRKSREDAIKTKKVPGYLWYALGEISLIVIGILIALQISNWNEDKQRERLEKKTLIEIENELSVTRGEVQLDLDNHLREMDEMRKLCAHLIEKKPPTDNLWLSFVMASRDHQAYPKTSAFENLKSVGLDIIRNDTLRREITHIYQLTLERLVDRGDYYLKYDIETAFRPFINKHLDLDINSYNEVPIASSEETMKLYNGKIVDYKSFINDKSLLREIQLQMLVRNNKIRLHHETIEQLDKVKDAINSYLNKI